jgi:hypothetical protein
MDLSFSEEVIKYFKDFVLCGIIRDQVIREMSEHIYNEREWISDWHRHELLSRLIELVYN